MIEPLVSVIIPTHNGLRHVGQAIESVLAQTYTSTEIIVADDLSEDDTCSMLEERFGSRVRVVHKLSRDGGGPAARNVGIAVATGDYLSFLDHDDLWEAGKLGMQMLCLREQPALDLVFGHMQNFFDDELSAEDRAGILSPMYPLAGVIQGTMLIRRSSFDRVGLFSEKVETGDFLEWYGRAQIAGLQILMLPEIVMRRRLHATNFSRTHKHLRRQYLSTLKQVLDARRKAAAEKTNS
jgi:glycosyltransferase involved in cell wall biosynthesis